MTVRRAYKWSNVALLLGAYLAFRLVLNVVRLPIGTPGWVLALASGVVDLGAIGLPIAAIAALVRQIGGVTPLQVDPGFAEPGGGASGDKKTAAGAAAPNVLLSALVALGGLALWFGLLRGERILGPEVRPALGLLGALEDLGKILTASGLGLALAGALREPNLLAPAAVFAAFADFVVVRFGTVHHALSTAKGRALVQAVSAQVPSIHSGLSALTIGPADFLFLGVLLACAHRFGFGLSRNAWVLAIVLAASLFAVPFLGALPALAPMCLTFLAWNWKRFALTRQELASTAFVLALMGGLFLSYFLFLSHGGH